MLKLKEYINKPQLILLSIITKTAAIYTDKFYLKAVFYLVMRKKLNLNNPKTYNEKIQWLKLYDRKPEYTQMVDKFEVKKYVSNIIGEEYIIPTLGIWNKFEDIDFNKLPNSFVLKCTNGSGGVIICKDKSLFDIAKARSTMNLQLKQNSFNLLREWPYKNVKNRIMAEEYMVDESGVELKDYKYFCFNGIPKFLFVASDRPHDTRFDFFDLEFNHFPFTQGHPHASKPLKKPTNFDVMIEISEKLSKDLPHIRVDLYNVHGKIYFGELTFYHFSGTMPFEPEEWDYTFGDLIDLPARKKSEK